MHYYFRNINEDDVIDISNWKYKDEYCIYSMSQSKELFDELTDGSYYAVDDENRHLVGYFCVGKSAKVPNRYDYNVYKDNSYLDMGLGLRPNLCGQGNGHSFVKAGIDYFSQKLGINKYRLTVASFNIRAIKVYERAGFCYNTSFIKVSNNIEFNVMTYEKDE